MDLEDPWRDLGRFWSSGTAKSFITAKPCGTAKMGVRSPWMNAYPVVLAGFGAIVLLTAWLPMVLKELPLSLPIFCVGLGVAIFAIPSISGYMPHPMEQLDLIEHLSEIVVIISLMGAGLSFDEAFSWSRWRLTWRLLGIAMPLTILGLAILGHTVLGLG